MRPEYEAMKEFPGGVGQVEEGPPGAGFEGAVVGRYAPVARGNG